MESTKTITLPIKPRKWQQIAFSDQHRRRFNVRLCHRGAGKSTGLAEYIVRYALTHPNSNLALCANEYPVIVRSVWNELKKLSRTLGEDIIYGNRQDFVWQFPATNSTLWCLSLSDPDRARGIHVDVLMVDEAQQINTENFRKILFPTVHNAYLKNPDAGIIWITGTAKYDRNLLYDAWHWCSDPRQQHNWTRQKWDVYSSGLYDSDYIEHTIRPGMTDEEFIQEYLCDFITSRENLVYRNFDDANIRQLEYSEDAPLHIGMDFNVSPFSAVTFVQLDKNTHYAIDEISIINSNTEEMAQEIRARYLNTNERRKITIYPDQAGRQRHTAAAGETDFSILRRAGFGLYVRPRNPQLLPSFRQVNLMLGDTKGDRKLLIHPRCENLIEGYRTLRFKPQSSIVDTSNPYVHVCDAARYYVAAVSPYGRAAPGRTVGVTL